MRRMYSYSKRETLETCPLRYFYEYYASAKKVPFDAGRKESVRALKDLSGCFLHAGELLHWAIRLFLNKPERSFQRWLAAERALRRGDELPVTVLAPLLSAGLALVAVVLILAVLLR